MFWLHWSKYFSLKQKGEKYITGNSFNALVKYSYRLKIGLMVAKKYNAKIQQAKPKANTILQWDRILIHTGQVHKFNITAQGWPDLL